MLVSHTWLQRFFDDPLPSAEEIADKLTFGVAEIESIQKIRHPMSNMEDTIIDVKVLPDRACYMLSHRGIAREIATLCGLPMKDPLRDRVPQADPLTQAFSVSVHDTERCPFYAAAVVKGVAVGPSPQWLTEHLAAIGQKSINNIVDAMNFVMFDLGTPLHVFDAAKLSGSISVRAARAGEHITILGGAEKMLTEEMTVIADGETDMPIAIAGVKGGAYAELGSATDIVIEAATFDALRTRKAAAALNLKTDASKRFENNIAVELPMYGMQAAVELILEVAGGELVGYATSALPHRHPYKLGITVDAVNQALGTSLTESKLIALIRRQQFEHESVNDPRARAVETAKELVGKPYKLGASITREAPHVFDCSSLVAYAYAQGGVALPRISIDQYLSGTVITREELIPGDVVFLNTKTGGEWYESQEFMRGRRVPEGVNHNGIYVGDDTVLHASQVRGQVVLEDMQEFEKRGVVGYRRFAEAPERQIVLSVPFERLDLRIPQDIIEEIARVYGYDNIAPEALPSAGAPEMNPRWAAAELVRKTLGELGFTEAYTYTLRDDGEVRLANALTADKSTLRSSLAPGLTEALAKNEYNAPLLGLDTVKIFEIGNVFSEGSETLHAAVAVRPLAQKKRAERANVALLEAKAALEKAFGVAVDHRISDEVLEFDLGAIVPSMQVKLAQLPHVSSDVRYKPLSMYPFVLRDIALWVTEGTSADVVRSLIVEHGGDMLVRINRFDEFTKGGRTSYAFHLVFQSSERTLSDQEINKVMEGVQKALKNKGWEVR